MTRVGAALAAFALAAGLSASSTSASAKPVRPWFDWLHMTNAKDGYALSGQNYARHVLLRTTDGGRVWHVLTRSIRARRRASRARRSYSRAA